MKIFIVYVTIYLMSRIVAAKSRLDRRSQTNILGRKKSAQNLRKTPPGMHGRTAEKRKISDYGLELMEVRKLRRFYGDIRLREMIAIFNKVRHMKHRVIGKFVNLLERRLATFVYRSKWALTPFGARQLVSHKKIKVNGKRVNISSYLVKVGDVVELDDELKQNPHIVAAINTPERKIPEYIQVNGLSAKFVVDPIDVNTTYPYNVDFSKIVTFLSKY